MASLSLTLLGRFHAHLDDEPLPGFRTNKVQALLTYLVVEPNSHTRESLMTLLWPGMPDRSARHNLRQVLYYLRSAIPELEGKEQGQRSKVSLLLANRQTIQLNPAAGIKVDVTQFAALLDNIHTHSHIELMSCPACRADLEEAVAFYQGDFLADFYLDDSNEFEHWSQMNRQAFRRKALDALEILTAMATRQNDYPQAQAWAHWQLDIDNLRESAYRQLMELLALSGRRAEALAVYENCRRLLMEELGMQPATRTTEIYEMIQAGELSFETPLAQGVRGYELKEEIGEGSHGTIHRAVQSAVGREVVVKIIRRKYANDPEFIRRFDAEAQTVARLEHPYIVPLYDYWRDPDGAYLVMRYLKGGSLLTALENGPWAPEPTIQMLEQIASALATAHQQGVIHRDIKPANILLDEAGNAYLSDFGIAKEQGRESQLTSAGGIIGTPDYISPEQILNEQVGPQSDIYSLGAVLYETLTGEKPFGDIAVASLIYKHLNDDIPMVSSSRPDLPAAVDDVIKKATSKRPSDRYNHPLELVVAFRDIFRDRSPTERVAIPSVIPAGIEVYNPYKGLQAFQEADEDDFFGRDALVDRLIARLSPSGLNSGIVGRSSAEQGDRFLALVGPSGSGKSSVVKAGLIPALRQGAVPGSERWFVAEMVPGTHPLEELEMALWSVAVDPPPSLVEPMQRDVRGMLRTLRRILPDTEEGELLLVIDQFEELFTLVEDEDRRDFFIDSLLAAISAPRTPLRVVITLRADFYDRPLQYQILGRLLKERTEIVLPLTPGELTWAVREPARRVGVSLEGGLAEVVVSEVADQPGGLPLLQYALTELFERRQGNRMTRGAYEEIGGVLGALSRQAHELYNAMDQAEKKAARQLFLRLVTLGEGVEDTRRRILRSELEAMQWPEVVGESIVKEGDRFGAVGIPKFGSVIDAFGQARLLTFDHDPVTRQPTVEVAHEALLREWSRLRNWLNESRDGVRLQRQLSHSAVEWLGAGKDDSFLLHGARLAQFADWEINSDVALTQDENGFLEASIAYQENRLADEEARRLREVETARKLAETESKRAEEQTSTAQRLRQRAYMLVGVLVMAIVLAIAAMLFGRDAAKNADLAATREAEAQVAAHAKATAAAEALNQKNIAEQERVLAQEQARVAGSRELAAASANNLGDDPELGILLAMEALSTANTNEAKQALHAAVAASRVRQRLVGHQGPIQRLAFTPDGSLIALAAHFEGLATVWETASGQKLYELSVGTSWGIYFDKDGRRLLAAEEGETLVLGIWDMTNGQKIESLSLPVTLSSDFAGYYPNPDWTQVAVAFSDGTVEIWDLRQSQLLFELKGHTNVDGIELEYSQDGTRLVTYDWPDGLVIVWDAQTGEVIRRLDTGEQINDHAVSPDGRRVALATGPFAQEVHIWDLDEPDEGGRFSPQVILTGHINTIRLLAFSPDGGHVASAGRDGTSRIWDSSTGESLLVLRHGSHVRSVVFSPEGNRLLTGDIYGVARVWDITPQGSAERLGLAAHNAQIRFADLSPDGRRVATASFDGTAKIWDLATGKMIQLLNGHNDGLMAIAYHPDGQRVATASNDGTARVWDIATGDELLKLEGHGGGIVGNLFPGVLGVDFSPDGSRLATAGADGTARIWDSDSGEELMRLEGHTAGLTNITYNPNGRYLATAGDQPDVTVRIWNTETGKEIFSFPTGHGDRTWGLDFSPDGLFLATSGGDATARIWTLEIGKRQAILLATITSHTNTVLNVGFSPDGNTLATADVEDVRLWDVSGLYDPTGGNSVSELLILPGSLSIVFNMDGSELIAGSNNGLLHAYLLDTDELRALARSRLTRWFTEAECQQYLHTAECPSNE